MNVIIAYHLSTTQDGGIPLSAFPKDTTSELSGFVFTLSFMLSAKQEAVNTNFLKSLVRPDLESNSGSLHPIRLTTGLLKLSFAPSE